ncbi:hypothetical protein CHARACLAT_022915 [Characodon lateralis]|uniref:Uncharacterized protein n=1 Tax=Characodon lateralis TaxID=208331 RepID=A0ABU7CQF1_9TELE|nr:hypothetical protein [Characodon lateralis]
MALTKTNLEPVVFNQNKIDWFLQARVRTSYSRGDQDSWCVVIRPTPCITHSPEAVPKRSSAAEGGSCSNSGRWRLHGGCEGTSGADNRGGGEDIYTPRALKRSKLKQGQ